MVEQDSRGKQFIENTFQLLSETLGASRFAYYSVDPEQNLHDFIGRFMPDDFIRTYVREMHACDPLHVRRLGSERVARLKVAVEHTPQREVRDYGRFLRHFEIDDTIDLIFRRNGRIEAGLSVMWLRGDPPPSDATFQLAERLHAYIEFNLMDHLSLDARDARSVAIQAFHLTPREAEVADLLCCGRTNADIAACLGIGLATVKTHLIHIFDKAGVENRSGLVARLAAARRH